jgi:hypothetical protein
MAEIEDFEQEIGEIEAVEHQEVEKQAEVKQEDEIPEEFRGLSQGELARKLKHSYREMGKQANELGEIRKLADELIKSQLQPKKEPEQPKEVDFFENPQEAIKRAVETNPTVLEARQYAIRAQQEQAKQKLHQMHPDLNQVIGSSDFANWVSASPVRKQLLVNADQGYDLNAAHELISTYKELRGVKQQQQQRQASDAEISARNQALKSASVDTGGSGETTKKIYRRADLIRLNMTDRAKYESMQDEIMQAYAEGRVR